MRRESGEGNTFSVTFVWLKALILMMGRDGMRERRGEEGDVFAICMERNDEHFEIISIVILIRN